MVRTIPDSIWYSTYKNTKHYSEGSGTTYIYSLSGKFLSKTNFKNGQVITTLNNYASNSGNTQTFDQDLQEVTVYSTIHHGTEYHGTSYFSTWRENGGVDDEDSVPYEGEGGGSGGDSGETAPPSNIVEKVTDSLESPCMDSAFNKVTDSTIKNYITKLYNQFYITSGKFDLTIKDAPNLVVNGDTVFAYSTYTGNIWEISLNSSYLTDSRYNMSEDAWGQIIIHEILHSFIFRNYNEVFVANSDHLFIFKNFVNPTRDLLMNSFGMSEYNATRLALNGIRDNWGYAGFDSLSINTYGAGLQSIDSVFTAYTKGSLGKKCN